MKQVEERWMVEARLQREDRIKMLERNARMAAEKEQRLKELGKNYVFPRKENTSTVDTPKQAEPNPAQDTGKLAGS